jgi:hypothetical protein
MAAVSGRLEVLPHRHRVGKACLRRQARLIPTVAAWCSAVIRSRRADLSAVLPSAVLMKDAGRRQVRRQRVSAGVLEQAAWLPSLCRGAPRGVSRRATPVSCRDDRSVGNRGVGRWVVASLPGASAA